LLFVALSIKYNHFTGTGHYHSFYAFDEHPFSGRKMHLNPCARVSISNSSQQAEASTAIEMMLGWL